MFWRFDLGLQWSCTVAFLEESRTGNFLFLKFFNVMVLETSSFLLLLWSCRCLPLDFMGFYSLAGYETDKKQKHTVKGYMAADIDKRREYIKTLMMTASERAAEQLPHIMPDYMLVFSVPVLTHNPRFTSFLDQRELVIYYLRDLSKIGFKKANLWNLKIMFILRPRLRSVYGLFWSLWLWKMIATLLVSTKLW